MKKFLSLLCTCMLLFGIFSIPAQAASTQKCYLIRNANTTVYSNTALSRRYGTIYGSDELQILSITSRYAKVTYPVSGSRTKTGYIKTSDIFTKTSGNTYTSKAKITTYRRPGGSSYGYIAKGDRVLVLGTYGNYTQVRYPVSGGYKFGFVATSTVNTYIKGNGNSGSSSNNTQRRNLSAALYNTSAAYISCGFDGYRNTRGKHEGIDIKYRNGASVYSLTAGTIVRITYGSCGTNGLSTIAIYNASLNKTVIYLHSAPISGLRVGQTIQKGQRIATESWRGISSSSSSHTHVEVRNGRCLSAAKSVKDYTLENSNPTSFWNSMGYNVK